MAEDEAKDVPMRDIFGGQDWTPATDHRGTFRRAGIPDRRPRDQLKGAARWLS